MLLTQLAESDLPLLLLLLKPLLLLTSQKATLGLTQVCSNNDNNTDIQAAGPDKDLWPDKDLGRDKDLGPGPDKDLGQDKEPRRPETDHKWCVVNL